MCVLFSCFCFAWDLLLCIDIVVHCSLSIVYGVLAASNWIAPSVVFLLGPKWSLFAGGCTYWLVFFENQDFYFLSVLSYGSCHTRYHGVELGQVSCGKQTSGCGI